MKKYITLLFLIVFIVPSVALASWWNPLSWFNGWNFNKTEITTENPAQKITVPNTTTTNDVSSKIIIPTANTKQKNPPVVEKTTSQKDTAQPQQVPQVVPPPVVIAPPQQPIVSTPLKTDNQKCQDKYGINSNWTGQVNSQGGPTCGCRSGYALDSNNICGVQKTGYQICSEKFPNETWDGTYNSSGGYNCICQSGYVWNNNQASCQPYVSPSKSVACQTAQQNLATFEQQHNVMGDLTTGTSPVGEGNTAILYQSISAQLSSLAIAVQYACQ